MARSIGKRFLYHSINCDLYVRRETSIVIYKAGAAEINSDFLIVSSGPLARQARQRSFETEIVQNRRPQFQCDTVYVQFELLRRLFQIRQLINGRRWESVNSRNRFESEQQC